MIEAFAPAQQLPIVMGFLFLITELLYALEPVIVGLVSFFGDTLTFIVGGILIAGAGVVFHVVSSDEVLQRKQELISSHDGKKQTFLSYIAILVIGLVLGLAKAFLIEFVPEILEKRHPELGDWGQYLSFGLLGLSAFIGFAVAKYVSSKRLSIIIMISFCSLFFGLLTLILTQNLLFMVVGGLITACSFSFINVSGLPFAIRHLTVHHITYGVGIYIGASEISTGIFEYLFR